MKYFIPLEAENYYHIFNHAVGRENFFESETNYIYFLNKYKEYIHPIADTFSYVLMPNHFHFLIKIRNREQLYEHYKLLEIKHEKNIFIDCNEFDFEKFTMQQFSNFFNCYTKSFNKVYDRKGALFIDYLRRTFVDNEEYRANIVQYIHQNPIHNKFCRRLDEWKYCFYNAILSERFTFLKRGEVLDWFGGRGAFLFQHTVLKSIEY